MGPILVNTKQKIAVLAAGLVVATTGFVTDQAAVAHPSAPVSATHERAGIAPTAKQKAVTLSETSGGGTAQTIGSKR